MRCWYAHTEEKKNLLALKTLHFESSWWMKTCWYSYPSSNQNSKLKRQTNEILETHWININMTLKQLMSFSDVVNLNGVVLHTLPIDFTWQVINTTSRCNLSSSVLWKTISLHIFRLSLHKRPIYQAVIINSKNVGSWRGGIIIPWCGASFGKHNTTSGCHYSVIWKPLHSTVTT